MDVLAVSDSGECEVLTDAESAPMAVPLVRVQGRRRRAVRSSTQQGLWRIRSGLTHDGMTCLASRSAAASSRPRRSRQPVGLTRVETDAQARLTAHHE
jgi:hypothetical protein